MRGVGFKATLLGAAIGVIVGLLTGCDSRGGASSSAGIVTAGTTFTVSFPAERSKQVIDGRVVLLLSRDFSREPRTHVEPNEPLASPYLFGLTVDNLAPAAKAVLDDTAFGWPATHLSAIPAAITSCRRC